MLASKTTATILALTFFFTTLMSGRAAGTGMKILRGHVPPAVARLKPIAALAPTNELTLAIGLPLRDEAGLDEFLRQLYDPASTNFHKFITPLEFAARFGPTESDYDAVAQFVESHGLKVTRRHPNRLVLDVVGDVAHVEKSFQIKLDRYAHPNERRDFFSPTNEPSVPVGLKITGISGLNNFSLPHPNSKITALPVSSKRVVPQIGSGPGNGYMGGNFRAAYVPGVPLTGTGQSVALLQFDGYVSNDIAAYISYAGLGGYAISLTNVPVNGGVSVPGADNGEVCLDIEMVLAMSPGVSKIYVYEGPNGSTSWSTILSQIANDNLAKQISCSWGGGSSDPGVNAIFQQMAAQGQSFFCASGDYDAYTTSVPFLEDNTNITLVGGTVLTTASAGGPYVSEMVWNDRTVNPNGGNWGSSGGVSPTYAMPSWQRGVNLATNLGSTTMRNLPDVALTGDNCFIVADTNTLEIAGGTSRAAPLWAGFLALVNEQAANLGDAPVGFVNPAIYAIGKGSNSNFSYAACFNDTASGDNFWSGSPAKYPAVSGFDLCTGWGTPSGHNLINALAPDNFAVTPNSGFAAVGVIGSTLSPSIQDFTLTNPGAATFNWSVINTSAWLDVSLASGSLPVGIQTNVIVSLNANANSLPVGNYNATVTFSNQATGIFQDRLFSLRVIEPLQLLNTNGLTVIGVAGGPFYPNTATISFTNQDVNPASWSLVNTAAWLSVSASSGSLPGHSSTSVTVTTNAVTANLANGIYSASLMLSNPVTHIAKSLNYAALIGTNIVLNGGFETGDFTGWTLSGNSGLISVSSTSTNVHSGAYGLYATATSSFGYLLQNVPTLPGQTYQFAFWYLCSRSTSQQFQAAWNGTNVYSVTTTPTTWSNQKFIVTATATNTLIQFGFLNSSGSRYFGLDDVSVMPINLPALTQQPASQTNFVGSNITFSATASGSSPLAYQWRTNGVNLVNGGNISGVNTNILTVTSIAAANAGNYTLVVTNAYGSITSSVASLTVLVRAGIASTSLTNRTVQCGLNTNSFSITASGTPPLSIQWKLDGSPVSGATNTSYAVTNLLSPSHAVSVSVTNLYGSVTSNLTLTVTDTLAPVITLNGSSRMTNELGSAFTDPGATASDACAGTVPVTASGAVNINAVGTNTLTYSAGDGNGNTNTATRTVIIRDTTPPTILWSFTNLSLSLDTNCNALMPDVTGTNYLLATDISGALTITQNPTNKFNLPLGDNTVVIAVKDASGNTAYSTNTITVADTALPVIVSQPQSRTNAAGSSATFTVADTACTPIAFQWYFNDSALKGGNDPSLTLTNLTGLTAGNYFAVATSDGGSSTSQVATLTVTLNPAPKIDAASANPSAAFTLNFPAIAGFTYILETTTNISASGGWQPVATNTPATNGVITLTDPQAANFPQRFYRIESNLGSN